jgi:hypothetical protein
MANYQDVLYSLPRIIALIIKVILKRMGILGSLFNSIKRRKHQSEFEGRIAQIDAYYMDTEKLKETLFIKDVQIIKDPSAPLSKYTETIFSQKRIPELNVKIKEWIKLRKQKKQNTEGFVKGIQLFLDYGVYGDRIIEIMEDMEKEGRHLKGYVGETLEYLIHFSYFTEPDWSMPEDYESYQFHDFEPDFESKINTRLKLAGINNWIFKSTAEKNKDEFIYTIEMGVPGNMRKIILDSAMDLMDPIYAFTNQILIEQGIKRRFYNLGPHSVFLNSEAAEILTSRYRIIFNNGIPDFISPFLRIYAP